MEKVSWLWPLKGGTWKERMITLVYALELVLGCVTIYYLTKVLTPYF